MKVFGQKKSGTIFYCFSPPVMIATFLIEASLLLYVVLRYRLNAAGRIIVALLACLASFQLAEYMVCEGSIGSANSWARFGFAAITLLPPLGLYLVHTIRPSRLSKKALKMAFSIAALLIAYFILAPHTLVAICTGNYIIFRIPEPYNILNGVYYYAVIFGSFLLARYRLRSIEDESKQQALKWYSIGVLAFFIPTGLITIINRNATEGLPSVMCGFALILALILTFKVAPAVSKASK